MMHSGDFKIHALTFEEASATNLNLIVKPDLEACRSVQGGHLYLRSLFLANMRNNKILTQENASLQSAAYFSQA